MLSRSHFALKMLSITVICNHLFLSTAGKNYRSVLDSDGHYNNRQKGIDWDSTFKNLKSIFCALRKLIDIKDGYIKCNIITSMYTG